MTALVMMRGSGSEHAAIVCRQRMAVWRGVMGVTHCHRPLCRSHEQQQPSEPMLGGCLQAQLLVLLTVMLLLVMLPLEMLLLLMWARAMLSGKLLALLFVLLLAVVMELVAVLAPAAGHPALAVVALLLLVLHCCCWVTSCQRLHRPQQHLLCM